MAAIQGQPVERARVSAMPGTLHQGRREDRRLHRMAVLVQRAVSAVPAVANTIPSRLQLSPRANEDSLPGRMESRLC
jgi:hypothetical protein